VGDESPWYYVYGCTPGQQLLRMPRFKNAFTNLTNTPIASVHQWAADGFLFPASGTQKIPTPFYGHPCRTAAWSPRRSAAPARGASSSTAAQKGDPALRWNWTWLPLPSSSPHSNTRPLLRGAQTLNPRRRSRRKSCEGSSRANLPAQLRSQQLPPNVQEIWPIDAIQRTSPAL